MNQNYSTVAQRSSSAIATNKVLRSTYTLLSLTLLFSGLTAALSMFMNMPPMTYMISVIGGMVIAMFVLPRFANSTAGIGIVFLITGMLGFGLGPRYWNCFPHYWYAGIWIGADTEYVCFIA